MLSWFKNASIAFQTNSIGILACIGFIILGVNFIISETHIEDVQHEQVEDIHALEAAEVVHYQFLNARRREKDFLSRMDVQYIDKHDEVMRLIDKEMKTLMNKPVMVDEKAKIEEINTLLKGYEAKFASVVANWKEVGLTEKEGLRG